MELLTVLTNFSPDPPPPIPRMVTDENVDILKTTGFAEASTLHIIITAWGGWWGGGGGGQTCEGFIAARKTKRCLQWPIIEMGKKSVTDKDSGSERERGGRGRGEREGRRGGGGGGRHQDKGAKREHSYCMHVGIINRVDAIMSQEYYRKGGRGRGGGGGKRELYR